MTGHLRPLTVEDAEQAGEVRHRSFARLGELKGWPTRPQYDDEARARWRRLVERYVDMDAAGAWAVEVEGALVGLALSIRRESLWGLSILAVDPDHWAAGLGRQLLDGALMHAEGAAIRMIQSSESPGAIRRYARAGLRLHPGFMAEGKIDRGGLPGDLGGRDGTSSDLDLVDAIDADVRFGIPRTADIAYLLDIGRRLHVVEEGASRAFAVTGTDGVKCLGATDEAAARTVLLRALAAMDADVLVHGLTADQAWAADLLLDVRLDVKAGGPMFLEPGWDYPGPYVPSGLFF